MIRSFIIINNCDNKKISPYPHESGNTMLVPLLVLILFTLFIGFIGIPFNQEGIYLDILSKWLTPSINLLHKKLNNQNSFDWSEFVTNATLSVSIAYSGIVIASFLYKPIYSSLQNFDLINFFAKKHPKRFFSDKIQNVIYDWAHHRGYIDAFYTTYVIRSVRGLSELVHFFDRRVIDGIPNGFGLTSFFVGEGIKYVGGGRISSYLFLYIFYASIFLLIYYFYFTNMNFTDQ